MATASSHVPLRDDSTLRSLCTNERTFLRSCATSTSTSSAAPRLDGRNPTESRPLRLTFGRSHACSECTVRLGSGTRAAASVTSSLIPPPNRDRPSDGQVRFGIELSPMAGIGFGASGPVYSAGGGDDIIAAGGGGGGPTDDVQKLLANRILRTLERTLLSGGAIDSEALCVRSGRWVWRLAVDVVVLDHGGNLVDACVLAAVAALRHFRKPEVEVDDDGGGDGVVVLSSDEREPTPLPLHHTPLSVTFALFSDRDPADSSSSGGGAGIGGGGGGGDGTVAAFVDPTDREEMVADGTVTLSYNKHGEMCGLDFPGGTELRPRQLVKCAKLGERRCRDWCQFLEDALVEADGKAGEERMGRLRAAAAAGPEEAGAGAPPPPAVPLPPLPDGVPYAERTDPERDGSGAMEVDGEDLREVGSARAAQAAAAAEAAAEEERYRLRALDYSLGHVAARVKEDGPGAGREGGGRRGGQGQAATAVATTTTSLMDAMLRSAAAGTTGGDGSGGNSGGGAPLPRPPQHPTTTAASTARTQEAHEEFEAYAASASAAAAGNDGDAPKSGPGEEGGRAVIPPPAAAAAAAADVVMGDSDDEEEVTTLRSEFSSISREVPASAPAPAASTVGATSPAEKKAEEVGTDAGGRSKKQQQAGQDGDDVDDLAMAVIKKKGKKSKKTKKGK